MKTKKKITDDEFAKFLIGSQGIKYLNKEDPLFAVLKFNYEILVEARETLKTIETSVEKKLEENNPNSLLFQKEKKNKLLYVGVLVLLILIGYLSYRTGAYVKKEYQYQIRYDKATQQEMMFVPNEKIIKGQGGVYIKKNKP